MRHETQQAYDRSLGTITCVADIPEQSLIQITKATRQTLLAAAEASVLNAVGSYPGTESEAALFFSCAARRQILGTKTKEEYQIAKRLLTGTLPSCGFYANGELAPLTLNGQTQFHNESFVTLLLGTK